MRTRKWVLVLAFVGFLAVFGGYFGWHISRVNDKLRVALLDKIRPFLSQESDIEKIDVSMGNIHMEGVRLAAKDGSFLVEIEDVRIGYRLLNLIRFGLLPHRITHEIVLVHPRLTIRRQTGGSADPTGLNGWLDPKQVLPELTSVKLFTLKNAEIIYEEKTGSIQIAHSLNGWMNANDPDSVLVRLSGHLFQTEKRNLQLSGSLDLNDWRILHLSADVQETDPSALPILPSYFDMLGGKVHGEVHYDAGFPVQGTAELVRGRFALKNAPLRLEETDATMRLSGDTMFVQGRVRNFHGSQISIGGHLLLARDPLLSIRLTSQKIRIRPLFESLAAGFHPSFEGEAEVAVSIGGSVKNIRIQGTLRIPDLGIGGFDLGGMEARYNISGGRIVMTGTGGIQRGFAVQLGGEWTFSDKDSVSHLNIRTDGVYDSLLGGWKREMQSLSGKTEFNLKKTRGNISARLEGELAATDARLDTLRLRGLLNYVQGVLVGDIWSNKNFSVNGEVRKPFQRDVAWEMHGEGFEDLTVALSGGIERKLIPEVHVRGSFAGTGSGWQILAEGFTDRTLSARVMNLDLESKTDDGKNDFILNGEIENLEDTLQFQAEGRWDDSKIELNRGRMGDFISAQGTIPFSRTERMNGRIKLDKLKLESFHTMIPSLRPYQGEVRGDISIAGTWEKPQVDYGLTLGDGVFHQIGKFHGGLEGVVDNGKFRLISITLNRNSSPVFVGGTQRVEGDSLTGRFWMRDVDLGELSAAFAGDDLVRGNGSLELGIQGPMNSPVFTAKLDMTEGGIGDFSFSEMQTEIVDTLVFDSDGWNGRAVISKGRLDRNDGLKVLLWGSIFHGRKQDLDLSVLASGNVLGVLSDITSSIKRSKGMGEIFMRWGGTPEEPVLGSGRLLIEGGELELGSFVQGIQDLHADVEFKYEGRFVAIRKLTGIVSGEKVVVSNEPVPAQSDRQPLVLAGIGGDLGIVHIETRGKGLLLALPGLMEKGDRGWLDFKGREKGEKFTIAGPSENPLIRGTLALTEVRLTYPFLVIEDDPGTDRILNALRSFYWDLRIIPVKDVHYVRNIESPLGNIYADLQLRDGYGEFFVEGISEEGTLQTWGKLVSTEGTIDALDHYFRPENITLDYPKGALNPILSGRAFTTVIDSLGMPSTIWLNLTSSDDVSGMQKAGGEWSDIKFRFSTDNPNIGRTEADLLAALGYSIDSIKDRAYDVLGLQVENLLFRPLFRPLEKGIRRTLGLDVVRLSSMFSRNLMEIQTTDWMGFEPKYLFRSTRLMVGKYLASGLFLTYSGQIQNGFGFRYPTQEIGFRHALNLEFSLRPDLFLEMEYTYDSLLLSDRREDRRIWLRHIFVF